MPQATHGGARSDSTAAGGPSTASRPAGETSSPGAGADGAKQKAADAAQSTKAQAQQAQEELRRQAAEATETAKQKAMEAGQRAKESGRVYASEKQTQLADEIGVFSGAIRKAADKLHEEEHDSIASYVDAAAEQLDHVRGSLKSKSVGEMVEDAQDTARQRPELVYGGMFVAGLAIARFLKASGRRERGRSPYASREQSSDGSSRTPGGPTSRGARPPAARRRGPLKPTASTTGPAPASTSPASASATGPVTGSTAPATASKGPATGSKGPATGSTGPAPSSTGPVITSQDKENRERKPR